MIKYQKLVTASAVLLAALAAAPGAFAIDGFYGGLSLRDRSGDQPGLAVGSGVRGLQVVDLPLTWNRYAPPTADDSAQRTLVFGGYRWKNDVSVEAAVNSTDQYAFGAASLRPTITGGLSDLSSHTWNADVYTGWEMGRNFSLYGRVGYAQADNRPLFAGASVIPGDPRRRDGVNYGLGLRYDMTHSLGLRVEYARFGRFTGEVVNNGLPESDQLSIGVQFRF